MFAFPETKPVQGRTKDPRMKRLLSTLVLTTLLGCGNRTGDARVLLTPPGAQAPVAASSKAHPAPRPVYTEFPGAYISSSRDGEYDIVLVNDTLRAANDHGKNRPLKPVAQPPLQQAMVIHVFWRPVSGAMVRESSVTNAIVHWYVFSGESSGRTDMLHYQGAAFVKIKPSGDTATVTIGDGDLAPTQARGDLQDPIGPSRVTADIIAVRNDARVRELQSRIADKAQGKDRFWTEANAQ